MTTSTACYEWGGHWEGEGKQRGRRRGGGGGGRINGHFQSMGDRNSSVADAYHCGADDNKGHRPILRRVIHADGPLVLGEHIGKGGVDGNGVYSVQAARHIGDAGQSGPRQKVEPVIVLQSQHEQLEPKGLDGIKFLCVEASTAMD